MSMTIQDFYKEVLTALSFKVDEQGLISFVSPAGDVKPTTVDGRRLVLPTDERLKEGFGEELQPFHPISENIARKGASPVLAMLQRTAHALIAHHFTNISEQLLMVAADPSLHKYLPPDCSEYLKKVPQADKKCLKNFQDLVKKAITKKRLVSLYLKNGGKYQGEKVNRLCVIRFPILDELETDEKSVLGVDLREKDKKTIKALLHYVMPFGDDPEEYSAGSNARVAPFFDAFLHAYLKVVKQLNKMITRYNKPLEMDTHTLSVAFGKHLDDIPSFYGKIASLRGNEGGLSKGEEESVAETPAASQPTAPASNVRGTPPPAPAVQRNPQQPARSSGGTMSVDEFLGRNQQPQQPPQGYAQQPPQQPGYGYNQPQQQMGYGYNQPMNTGYPPAQPASATWLGGGQPQQPPQQHPFVAGFQSWGGQTQQQQPAASPGYNPQSSLI